ncbi:hypothetical protein PSTG_06426 [Puccinia striiformis f. sp. tritici PST-78]|uniref:Uncharacterized protein n=1 Tax=Puccinia striiformis f. sp. tritici PST-78 TaxID=1165861 RepID=A0A0L0VLT8_9BASI|nr:hypothetical protein PSTG_06426 [Puccinia striiformis f. sp. tritici PST-78]
MILRYKPWLNIPYDYKSLTVGIIFTRAFKIPSHQTPTIKYPELYKSSQGKSRLPDQESLVYVLKQHTERKPVQIDLTYQHPNLNHEEILKDEDSDLDPCPPESSVKRRHYFSTDPAKARNQDEWALGGIACTMPRRGVGSLNTQLGMLGRGACTVNIDIKTSGWTSAF